jgi:hypothetical protein
VPVKLRELSTYFSSNRKSCKVLVSDHAWKDHRERGFTALEIVDLVKNGRGSLRLNTADSAIEGSVVLHVKDRQERKCELVLIIKEDENIIRVCSAWRRSS